MKIRKYIFKFHIKSPKNCYYFEGNLQDIESHFLGSIFTLEDTLEVSLKLSTEKFDASDKSFFILVSKIDIACLWHLKLAINKSLKFSKAG